MSTNSNNNVASTNQKIPTFVNNNITNKSSSQLQSSHHHQSQQSQAYPSQLPQLQQHHARHQTQQQIHTPATATTAPSDPSLQQKSQSGPPRYQPPPQPSSGILKHLPNPKSGIPTFHHSPEFNQLNKLTELKYPPEVPKLATVHIPDSVRNNNNNNPSRIATSKTLQQNRQTLNSQHSIQSQPSPQNIRLVAEEEQANLRSQQQEMLKFVRKTEPDSVNSIPGSSNNVLRISATAEQNRHFQSLITELRALKDANQRLSDDNQELRDLCCFLDDDRQKGRKLAREWQRFGRYTASVMRQEVSAYQNKLRQLDDKQQELIRDNLELKELCLYLDEERANVTACASTICTNCGATVRSSAASAVNTATLRDDGDGSSSSTNDEPMPSVRPFDRNIPDLNSRITLTDQTLQYVRSLEQRISQLEQEHNNNSTNIHNNNSHNADTNTNGNGNSDGNTNGDLMPRPEAVVRALQILEVKEQLERDRVSSEEMDENEKALLREMCNVVWRKLEENPNMPRMDQL